MGLGWKVALLNIMRNGRRSLITLAAIVFGCTSLIVFGGFVQSMYDGMRESMIRSQLGHIQIYANGYNQYGKAEPEKYLIPDRDLSTISQLIESESNALVVAPRLNFNGLLSDGKQSIAITGIGIDAEKEVMLSSAIRIVDGEDLFPEDIEAAHLGEGLFNALDVQVGDYLTLLASTQDGAINAVDVQVMGVISTGVKALDDRLLRVNLPLAQELLYTSDITRMVVLLDETQLTDTAISTLVSAFEQHHLDLELKSWEELAGYYHQVVGLFNGVFEFITVIVLIIVALSISNTMLMAVMERTRELGTIRAMGGTPRQVVSLILLESVFLGLIGSLLGLLMGALAAKGITYAEWMMPRPPGSTQDYPIRVFVVPDILFRTFLLGFAISLVSSLYPAVKASRLPVVKALRFT
ncbi:FtsX-like permease family protein [Microbulbifer sp. OS29]|uniref:FtsX-like permease family protein n=1 Tax=Microbulbifer okhotskensis TaxID=2926617 RepID=A0A9X2EM32_9GAMM|nr:FtsX-like permease family protein [Microbulbifer okhotskensis]MCO1334759.1 FtsX-like permease family protein [Microbulbifer okhotskensis]